MNDSETACDIVALQARLDVLDWEPLVDRLDACGYAVIDGLLSGKQCDHLQTLYEAGRFRRRVVMEQHGYGRGEYQYFAAPLPAAVALLRNRLYMRLAPLANRWNEALGDPVRYPLLHEDFVARCHAAGQIRPTPLLLRYRADDYNRLHQDLYGEHVFPMQITALLSRPGQDFAGGEFVLTEQRPRMQSRVEVVPLQQGDAVVFAVHRRPGRGPRGTHRLQQRHGVSRVVNGERYALGVIFHDAQ